MAISLAGTMALSGGSVTSGGTVASTLPTGTTAGEFLLWNFGTSAGSGTPPAATAPTGWSPIAGVLNAHANYLWYRIATGSEGTTINATVGTTTGTGLVYYAGIQRYAGVDTTTPIDAAGLTASTTTPTAVTLPSVTTVTANAWQLALLSVDDVGQASEPVATGFTALYNGNAAPSSREWRMYSRTIAAPGATGTSSWATTASYTGADSQGLTFGLRPAGATNTTVRRNPSNWAARMRAANW